MSDNNLPKEDKNLMINIFKKHDALPFEEKYKKTIENNLNKEDEDFIKKMVKDSIPEIRQSGFEKWAKFSVYLDKQRRENKVQEFRLVLLADDSLYIQPLGKDGETIDMNLFN
jgi:hypothetical protein